MKSSCFSRLPLAVLLPTVLMVVFATYAMLSGIYTYRQYRVQQFKQAEYDLRQTAIRLTRLAEHDPGDIGREVMLFAAEPAVRVCALLEPDGKIIAAHRTDWIGREIGDVWPRWQPEWLQRTDYAPVIESQASGETYLLLVTPYTHVAMDTNLGGNHRGVLILERDLSSNIHGALREALQPRLLDIMAGLGFMTLTTVWLRRRIGHPLRQLVSVAESIGRNPVAAVIEVKGCGEILELASALQIMTETLRHNIKQMHEVSMAVEKSPVGIVITDEAGNIKYANAVILESSGYSLAELLGHNPCIFKSSKTPSEVYANLWQTLQSGNIWQGELVNRRKDGREYIEQISVGPIKSDDGSLIGFFAVKLNVSVQKSIEAQIDFMQHHDGLTGLPNRQGLEDRLTTQINIARRHGQQAALVLVDLDHFKTINDARGMETGDAILKATGGRLRALLRDDDMVARLGADEFGLLLADINHRTDRASQHAQQIAEKLHMAFFSNPLRVGAEEFMLSLSMGITLFPESPAQSPSDILRRAETALHRAKEKGTGQTAFYETSLGDAAERRYRVEQELRAAIAEGQLRLYLQSQVDPEGRVIGAEALVRWQHPTRGLKPPAMFIPIAEESRLIIDIGQWVLSKTCRLLAVEQAAGRPIRLAVNVSPRQFHENEFVALVQAVLDETGADPRGLVLEVTEGLILHDIEETLGKMHRLAMLGVQFSIDDFGTGYSSLAYLKRLPISEIKIDKSFVQDAPSDSTDAVLVETMLSMARHLNYEVVAEGVETEAHAAFLNAHGRLMHQGYLYGKPEPAAEWIACWQRFHDKGLISNHGKTDNTSPT